LVFFGDILEFVEQDKVFLADVLFDSWYLVNWGNALLTLEVIFLTKLKKQTLSVILAKMFRV
jgi:hypothetical protein